MPTTLQKKVMDYLEKIADDCGLDFVEQKECSNAGSVFLQVGFKTVLSFSYLFQDQDCTISLQWFPEGKIARRSVSYLNNNCILNIRSDITSLPESIEKCESLIRTVSSKKDNIDSA